MTNKIILTASILSFLLTAIHAFGGGADVHVPLLETDISTLLKGFISVIWHAVTANLIICSTLLIIAARNSGLRILLTGIVVAHYLAYISLFLFYGYVYLGTPFAMLPWIGFSAIVIIALVGLKFDKSAMAKAA